MRPALKSLMMASRWALGVSPTIVSQVTPLLRTASRTWYAWSTPAQKISQLLRLVEYEKISLTALCVMASWSMAASKSLGMNSPPRVPTPVRSICVAMRLEISGER